MTKEDLHGLLEQIVNKVPDAIEEWNRTSRDIAPYDKALSDKVTTVAGSLADLHNYVRTRMESR